MTDMEMDTHLKTSNPEEQTSLEWIMKRPIRTLMEVPTKDQIYDNVSFKLGAFYKRFWQNTTEGLKQNTRKAGQILLMAENMRKTSREDDRYMKVFAYAREIKKFCADNYEDWKKYIWLDFTAQERMRMEEYVNDLTPPMPYKGESRADYDPREKARLFEAYGKMKRAMLFIEIFEKIWTIRMYRKNGKPEDVKRHQKIGVEMLSKIKGYFPHFRAYVGDCIGLQEWQQIEQMW